MNNNMSDKTINNTEIMLSMMQNKPSNPIFVHEILAGGNGGNRCSHGIMPYLCICCGSQGVRTSIYG